MSITQNGDYIAQALALMQPRVWSESTGPKALLEAFVQQIQDLEDDFIAINTQRIIANAVGVQLDQIGKLIGQPRWDSSDSEYRRLLGYRIIANSGQGTPDPILDVISDILTKTLTLLNGGAAITLTWSTPAVPQEDIDLAILFLEVMLPSGVGFALHEIDTSITPAFRFDLAGQGMDQGKFDVGRVG